MLEIFIFLQKSVNLERETRHAVFNHANTSSDIKIPTFWKNVGDDVELVQCPFENQPFTYISYDQITDS